MPETIKDGTGSGQLAKVNHNNRLYTASVTKGMEVEAAENGDYYMVCNGTSHDTTQNGWRLHLKNTSSTHYIHVQEIQVSCDSAGRWHLGYNGIPSSGTDIDPVNFNIGSTKQPTVEASYDGAMTFSTDPSYLTGGRVEADVKYIENYGGSMVIPPGSSIQLSWNGDGAGTIAFAIQFYVEEIGESA